MGLGIELTGKGKFYTRVRNYPIPGYTYELDH